jgi:cell wall-associated NlpC family hydrolase
MTRRVLLLIVVAAGAGCASTGAYSPRPFPGAPAAAASAAAARPADRALTSAVIATALDLRGVPYRLGGADLSGFDCSGFVQYVLRQHAVDMPRTVAEQFQVGARAREIAPGDLVFFQTEGSKASHVGIAVDAESFVHAPNSRGVVRVERLDSSYWAARFIGARRVL